ncbi:MAG: hypothetical protein AB1938_15345, partial [Myxococcota bacterium]
VGGGAGGGASGGGAGGGGGGGVELDGGSTFDPVELASGVEVHAVALEAVDGGFLVAWVESDDFSLRLMTTAVDERGELRNLQQTVTQAPSAAAFKYGMMLPGALQPQASGQWRVTAVLGARLVTWGVSDFGFPGQPVLDTYPLGQSWALEGAGVVLERSGGDTELRTIPGGERTTLPSTLHTGQAIGAVSDGGFTLLTTNSTGALALETLIMPSGGRVWDSRPLAQAPSGMNGPFAVPLALRASSTGWIAAWVERSHETPRMVSLRVRRPGAEVAHVEDETAWLSANGDVVVTPGGRWAVAWSAVGGGWNDEVRFRREGGAAVCAVSPGGGANHNAGPIALAARASGRVGILWAQPQFQPPDRPRRARLLFRSLGADFCP